MDLWDSLVDVFRQAIFAYTQICGGQLGGGILVVTLLIRGALLPLSLRVAKISAAHQQQLRDLQPELKRLRARYERQPERLAEETRQLLQRKGVSATPLLGCLGTLGQLPIMMALFTAVRDCAVLGGPFLWIRNLARPDLLLSLGVAVMTFAAAYWHPGQSDQQKYVWVLLPTMLTLVALTQLSAAVALYWGATSATSLMQVVLLQRDRETEGGAA